MESERESQEPREEVTINDHFTTVLVELEASDDRANLNLVLEDDGVRAVDHQVVTIFTHNTE